MRKLKYTSENTLLEYQSLKAVGHCSIQSLGGFGHYDTLEQPVLKVDPFCFSLTVIAFIKYITSRGPVHGHSVTDTPSQWKSESVTD